MREQTLTFPALDGRTLSGALTQPDDEPRGALVIFSALGVPLRYYARFAAHLAGRGLAVLRFDYRGVGASRDRPLRRDPATLQDWARRDAAGAVDLALERFPGLPIMGLGHSFGGQSFGLNPRARDLDRLVIVAAGSGDLALYPPDLRRRYGLMLGGLVPVTAAILGYIPGRLGLGEDLPAGVVSEWARWCQIRGYATGAVPEEERWYGRIEAPLLFVEAAADTFAPPEPAAALRSWYTGATVTHRALAVDEVAPSALGHFGVFRAGAEPVWDEIADFLGAPPRALPEDRLADGRGAGRRGTVANAPLGSTLPYPSPAAAAPARLSGEIQRDL